MIKRKLKSWVIPALSAFVVTGCILCYYLISNLMNYSVTNGPEYVTETLMEEDMPVNKEVESQTSIKPYNNEHVQISKNYYNQKDDEQKQQSSLLKYEHIYINGKKYHNLPYFEKYLNDYGVNCKLVVLEQPDGKKDLYFDYANRSVHVQTSQACPNLSFLSPYG